MNKALAFFYAYLVATFAMLLIQAGYLTGEQFVKPLLVPLLAGLYITASSRRSGSMLLALLGCWAGDVMFAHHSELYFLLGLSSFLVGHIAFIRVYREERHAQTQGLLPTQKARFAFPVLLAGTGLLVILYPSLGDLRLPVIVYAGVLTLMALQALFRSGHTHRTSFGLTFAGALLFMLSDSLLALNKFGHGFQHAGFWIMLTYCGAVLLITLGITFHDPAVKLFRPK